jgi:protein arginine kinase activator
MKCDICSKPATVHLTEIINDQMTELHLCEDCANKKGAQVESQFGLAEMLTGLADVDKPRDPEPHSALVCANCGMSYDDFRKVGRLGCSECYDTFRVSLKSLLKRIHGAPMHLGKSPGAKEKRVNTAARLAELKHKLEDAVKREAFEEAAALRDRIHALELELKKKKS